jgi:hypothetical protein
MITIETTLTAIATKLKCPKTYAQEVVRRLFLTSDLVTPPEGLRVNIAQTEQEYSGQISCSKLFLTVQKRGWGGNKVTNIPTLLTYIETSAKALIDLSKMQAYTGPAAPAPTGVDPDPKWVPVYPPQGKYAVYPPSIALPE